MFDNLFNYLPIVILSIATIILFNKVWHKRDLITRVHKESKEKYKVDRNKKTQLTKINYLPIVINLLFMGYNIKLFFTDFSNNEKVFFNFWAIFFLLLLNIPFFIYKDHHIKHNKKVALFIFLCLSVFCFPILFIEHSINIIILYLGWLINYSVLIFNSNQKIVDNLKGQTGFFIIFWVIVLVISIVLDSNFDLPQQYNYAYLINTFYFMTFAYFNYFSNRYENI